MSRPTMTLNELIAQLEELRDGEDAGEAEVRVAYQQNYPLAGRLEAITLDRKQDSLPSDVLWFAIGSVPYDESPYAPAYAWSGEVEYPEEEESDLAP